MDLSFFDVSSTRDTAVSVDASPVGLGAVLWQRGDSSEWKPISCASRLLTSTETRYSQLEREMLAIVFGLVKFRQFVLGRHVTVFTDHKPLVSIIKKTFDEVPARVQRWLLALLPYDFVLEHRPGTAMVCADALSRSPVSDVEASAEESRSMQEFVGLILAEAPVSSDSIRVAIEQDPFLASLRARIISKSWSSLSSAEEAYFRVRNSLSVVDGLIMLDSRFVVPESLRKPILRLAHEGHPGLEIFLDNLRRSVWWPQLTRDATDFAQSCEVCWRMKTNSPQPLQPSDVVPVWHTVAVDLVEICGRHLLSLVDYGSRYPELVPVNDTSSRAIVQALMSIFARFGFPRELISDNGPQFVSAETKAFLEQANIRHVRASPHYPCSNGMVERFHATVRRRFEATDSSLFLSATFTSSAIFNTNLS